MKRLISLILIVSYCTHGLASNENPPAICPTLFMSGSDVSCYGNTNGSASVDVQNGSNDYTITWSNGVLSGSSPSTISGLGVGTYTVNVLDNQSGCTVIGAFVVGSPDPISTNEIVTDVSCTGDLTGGVNVTTIGGNGGYIFSWSNGQNTEDLTNVGAGNYTLNITDSKGCTYSEIYTIEEPLEALAGSAVVSDASCFGSGTGNINLEVWGGTPSYSYLWNSGQSTQDISGLTTGNYSVTVTDFNGCTMSLSYFVDQPTVLGGTMSSMDVICYGDATGTVAISPTGGTLPYSYSWQNSVNLYSEDNDTLFNIPADSYQVTVTDANGCQYVDSYNVLQPAELVLSQTTTNVSCFGGSDGEINLTVIGGIPLYNYSWINSTGAVVGNNQDLIGVVAETYTVEVTDNNGCLAYLTQTVTQPLSPITTTFEVVDVLCHGENTGEVDLTAVGGTPPYSFSWSSGQTTEDIANMLAGTYDYTVVDDNGCIETGSATINEPLAPLAVSYVVIDVNCFGEANGSIDMTVTGGTPGYSFSWVNSTYSLSYTGEDLVNFVADDYTYDIVDDNGCTLNGTITISEPDELVVTLDPTHVLCYGEATGEIDLTAVGGTMPYSYLWSNSYTTEDLTGIIAGNYSVDVTDDHNCVTTASIEITQPSDTISFNFDVFSVLCNGGATGAIDLFVAGGTPGYNYQWSNGDDTSAIENLTAGYYVFDILDANNCLFTDSIYVDEPDPLLLNEVVTPVSCHGGDDGIIDITPTGGTPPFSYSWYNSVFALAVQTEDLIGVADVYQVEIIDSNGCFYEMFIELPEPDPIVIDYDVKQVTCYGWSDGAVYVDITGGNPGYQTNWSDGSFNEDLIDVVSDTFQLVVIDTKGCTDTLDVFVPQPDSLIINFETTPASCIDAIDGVGLAIAQGGNGGYMYEWSSGSEDESTVGPYGTYDVIVTDILGCTAEGSVYIPYSNTPCLDPPNAFTPNNDAYNDTWRIDNVHLYPDIEIIVFNKWGNKIHEQVGGYEPWDGKINGVDAPSATYYWIINPNYEDRSAVTGNVTIVR